MKTAQFIVDLLLILLFIIIIYLIIHGILTLINSLAIFEYRVTGLLGVTTDVNLYIAKLGKCISTIKTSYYP